jgi:hypothetical protein
MKSTEQRMTSLCREINKAIFNKGSHSEYYVLVYFNANNCCQLWLDAYDGSEQITYNSSYEDVIYPNDFVQSLIYVIDGKSLNDCLCKLERKFSEYKTSVSLQEEKDKKESDAKKKKAKLLAKIPRTIKQNGFTYVLYDENENDD